MKAKVFNTANSGLISDKSRAALLTINYENGLLSFSVGFVNKVKLNSSTRVAVIQDEERPKDWYIQTGSDEFGFPLRVKDTALAFNNVTVARELLESCELIDSSTDSKTARFLLATEPINVEGFGKLYAIITKSGQVVQRTRKK